LNDATNGVKGCGVRALGLDLGSCG
jgi:hypothetical protein